MGNAAAGRLGGYFANPTVLGAVGGAPSVALGVGNIPAHTHNGSNNTGTDFPDHNHGFTAVIGTSTVLGIGTGGVAFQCTQFGSTTGGANQRHQHSFSFTTDGGNGLGGTPFASFGPRKLVTFYMKL
jgi:microcystin-dependent protein